MEALLGQYVVHQSLGREKMNAFRKKEFEFHSKFYDSKEAENVRLCHENFDRKEEEYEHLVSEMMRSYVKLLIRGDSAAAVDILSLDVKLERLINELVGVILLYKEANKSFKKIKSAEYDSEIGDLSKDLDSMFLETKIQADALKSFNAILYEKGFPKIRLLRTC